MYLKLSLSYRALYTYEGDSNDLTLSASGGMFRLSFALFFLPFICIQQTIHSSGILCFLNATSCCFSPHILINMAARCHVSVMCGDGNWRWARLEDKCHVVRVRVIHHWHARESGKKKCVPPNYSNSIAPCVKLTNIQVLKVCDSFTIFLKWNKVV